VRKKGDVEQTSLRGSVKICSDGPTRICTRSALGLRL
jgi:hypothetical protein